MSIGYYIKICYLKKLNNNESIGLKGSSSVEHSWVAERKRTDMALKYCQSHKCHTYDTKDRKRGSKDNRVNQTRRRSEFYYGGGNFCSLNCYNDWADQFMDRAIDNVSGRLHEPMSLTEENAWRQVWNPRRYDRDYNRVESQPDYIERNMITGEERPVQDN